MRDRRDLPGFDAGIYFSRSFVYEGSTEPPAPAEFLLSKGAILMSDKALDSLARELIDINEVITEAIKLNRYIRAHEKKTGISRFDFDQLTRDKMVKEYRREENR